MFLKNPAAALTICFAALIAVLSPAVSYAQDRRLPPGPRTILSRMLAVYSNAASYEDTGELRVVGDDPSLLDVLDLPQPPMEKPLSVSFSTLFVRQPSRFRFEWQNTWSKTTRPSAIWSDGKRVYIWDADSALGDDRFSLNEHEKLSVAVGEKMTPSAGTAFIVPSLLLKEVAPYTFADVVRDLSDLRILRDEPVDGANCYVIRGRAPDAPWLLWVDKKTYYLRKVRSLFTAGSSHGTNNRQFVAEQIHHNINVNRRIPLKRFPYRPKIRRGDLDASRLSYEPAEKKRSGRRSGQ